MTPRSAVDQRDADKYASDMEWRNEVGTEAPKRSPKPLFTVSPGPRNAHTDPNTGLRFYQWQGRDLPSVTTIRRMAGLPFGLHNWTINQVINAAIDNIKDFATRLSSGDPAQVQLVRHELRGSATAERDKAAKLGTAVHDAAAEGRSIADVAPEVAPRLRQYQHWLRVSGAEELASEFQVWNLELGYAGTVDRLCRMRDGSVWVLDFKTGKGVYAEHALQIMAYSMAEFAGSDDQVDVALTDLLHEATGMGVLHLADDGWEFIALRPDSETWVAFRGLLAFAVWAYGHPDIAGLTLASRSGADEGAA